MQIIAAAAGMNMLTAIVTAHNFGGTADIGPEIAYITKLSKYVAVKVMIRNANNSFLSCPLFKMSVVIISLYYSSIIMNLYFMIIEFIILIRGGCYYLFVLILDIFKIKFEMDL